MDSQINGLLNCHPHATERQARSDVRLAAKEFVLRAYGFAVCNAGITLNFMLRVVIVRNIALVLCLFLGNSLVEAGCNTKSFETAWPKGKAPPKAMNVALGATSTVEHYLILKRSLQNRTHLTYVIYGFFDDQLNTAPNGAWSDLVGNRAFSYYFPDEAAEMYAPGSWFKKWQLRLTARVPMLAERSSLWGKVDLLRRSLEEVGMPRRKTNRFGRVEDFGALEAADAASFDRRCRTAAQGFSRPVEELLRLAHQRDATVILLEMPMPSHHRRLFYSSPAWQELRARLNSLAKQEGALYLSASDWIQDDRNFEDATHLNKQSASQFSSQLAGAVAWVSLHRPLAGTQGDAH